MGNIITNSKFNNKIIQMSNGLTSVFIETICLAGSDIAIENYQKDLMIWFSQRDWILLGMGLEGFDISEIIWHKNQFEQQKDFIIKVIDFAINKTNWDLLSYNPHEMIFTVLKDFKQMIIDFNIDFIDEKSEINLFDFDGFVKKYDKCEKHKIYLHCQGCVICNS